MSALVVGQFRKFCRILARPGESVDIAGVVGPLESILLKGLDDLDFAEIIEWGICRAAEVVYQATFSNPQLPIAADIGPEMTLAD